MTSAPASDHAPTNRKQLEVDRTPGVVGLFSPVDGNVFGHQVLAYGFDDSAAAGGGGILVYDSNHPDREVLIAPTSSTDARQAFELRIDGVVVDHYRGWFFMDFAYDRHNPIPPRYRDLVVTGSIRVVEDRPTVGGPLHFEYTVTNAGQACAHLDQLYVWVRRDGANRDDLGGGGDGDGDATPLDPGAARAVRTGTGSAHGPAGAYRAGASYLLDGQWRNLPAQSGTRAQIDFSLTDTDGPQAGWHDLGGVLTTIATGLFADGRVAVFGVGLDGRMYHRVQIGAASRNPWTDWAPIGRRTGFAGRPAVAAGVDGRLEVFCRDADGRLWHMWQTERDGGWSDWAHRGDGCTSDAVASRNADGRLELFVRGTAGDVLERHHIAQPPWWSDWSSLGGRTIGDPAVIRRGDGTLSLFSRGPDRNLVHRAQAADGS